MIKIYLLFLLVPSVVFADAYWSCQGFESLKSGSPDFGYIVDSVDNLKNAIEAAKDKIKMDYINVDSYVIQCHKFVKDKGH